MSADNFQGPEWDDSERLKLVLRGSNDALWDWDLVAGKLHYSSRWFEMVGYQHADFTDDPDLWRSILHPEDAARVQRVFSHALENGTETYEVEFRFHHKSGHYVPVLSRGFISRDNQGKAIRVSGVNSDLTERKKQEMLMKQDLVNLSESETRFRTFFHECPIPLCNLEVGGDASSKSLLLINRAFREFFGYDHTEIPTMVEWLEKGYPDPAYREEAVGIWDKAVAEAVRVSGNVPGHEYRVRCKDGRDVIVLIGAIFLKNSLLVTFTDVTERKKAEREALEREDEFRQILNNIPLPVSYSTLEGTDENFRIKFNNREFVKVLGYTIEDIPTFSRWCELAYPDAAYREASLKIWGERITTALEGNGVLEPVEYKITRKDGVVRDIIVSAMIKEKMIIGSFVDITDSKKAEQELKAARELERSFEERQRIILQQKLQTSMVAASVAHEINQPLGEIILKSKMAIDLIEDDEKDDPIAQLKIILNGLVNDSNRVVKTIEKMRALLRNVPSEHTAIDMHDVLESTLLHLKSLISRSQVRFKYSESGKPVLIEGDAGQLQLAFTNIIKNAIEAMEHLPIDLRVLAIDCSVVEGKVQVMIEDSGPGILAKIREQIFDLLTSSKPRGSGIGLYIVRTALHNHRGEVFVESSALGGANFRMLFPLLTVPLTAKGGKLKR